MKRVVFVTLFPQMVLQALSHSIPSRAAQAGLVTFEAVDPRDYAYDRHRTVDDRPYGGGPGMVMMAEPLIKAVRACRPSESRSVVILDPTGEPFHQRVAQELAAEEDLLLICGHYEGIDDRVRQILDARLISVGDFVLTGGELPALMIADAALRLVPGALGDPESLMIDSHARGLLSAPQFTRPENVEGYEVPSVLCGGDHRQIERYRRRESLKATRERRPDLFARATLEKSDLNLLSS